jgi:hypothetical protein
LSSGFENRDQVSEVLNGQLPIVKTTADRVRSGVLIDLEIPKYDEGKAVAGQTRYDGLERVSLHLGARNPSSPYIIHLTLDPKPCEVFHTTENLEKFLLGCSS